MFGLNLALAIQNGLATFRSTHVIFILDQFPSNTFLAPLITQRLNAPRLIDIPVGGRCNWPSSSRGPVAMNPMAKSG